MAFPSTTIWEARVGGADTNGGGFDPVLGSGSTDYSLQDAAEVAITDVIADGSADITSAAGAVFPADCSGNYVYLSGGTGSLAADWYFITGANTTTLQLNRVVASGTGITCNLGGAFETYGQIGKIILDHGVSGMIAFLARNVMPFEITNATANVSGGSVDITQTNESYTIVGYDSNRDIDNTDALRPTVNVGAAITPTQMLKLRNTTDNETQYAAQIIFDINGQNCSSGEMVVGSTVSYTESVFRRIKCDAGNVASLDGFLIGLAIECEVIDADKGFVGTDDYSCYAEGCNTGYDSCISTSRCVAYNGVVGFNEGGGLNAAHIGSLAIGNSSNGFVGDPANSIKCIDCVSVENAGAGYVPGSTAKMVLVNCASGDNTGGRGTVSLDIGAIILPGPGTYYTGAAAGDFRPAVTGDAALLKGAATYPQSSTDNAQNDVGAVQHVDPAGGGGVAKFIDGGFIS